MSETGSHAYLQDIDAKKLPCLASMKDFRKSRLVELAALSSFLSHFCYSIKSQHFLSTKCHSSKLLCTVQHIAM